MRALLSKGAIELVPLQQWGKGVYPLFFLILKKDGSVSPLTKFILSEHFHMVTLQDVNPLLLQGDFMTALELKDTYFYIPINPAHWQFLRFV